MTEHHEHHTDGSNGGKHQFDVSKLDKMKNPERLIELNPDIIWSVIGRDQPRVMVDVGAGIGVFAIAFARKVPHGVVYACDVVPQAIEKCAAETIAAETPNVRPVQVGETEIPLRDGLADLVFTINVHHHFPDVMGTLREFHRLLRPGGRVGVVDWKAQETPKGPPLEIRYQPTRVMEQLTEAGFEAPEHHDLLPYAFIVTARKPE